MKQLYWIRWNREESRETFAKSYKGFSIYLAVPNGGIVGASVIDEQSNKKAWVYNSECLEDPKYLEAEWHINQCKKKIDSLLNKKKRSPQSTEYPKQLTLF